MEVDQQTMPGGDLGNSSGLHSKGRRGDCSADLKDVESFWANHQPPAGPIRLNAETLVVNPATLVRGHLAMLRANAGIPAFRPYLNRLIQLKQIIAQ
jgi:hypothetical protein